MVDRREVWYYENFDITSVVTPVNYKRLKQLLVESNYHHAETQFLIDGFQNGFSIGYNGRKDIKQTAPNLKFRLGDRIVLWNKVMKEVKLKHFAGPFTEISFKDSFIQSPIGLVPKDNGKDVRLIFHLSYPRGTGTSLNANTPQDQCKVVYPDFNDAINLCVQAGRNCHVAKADVQVAFRNLGIRPSHFRYLIMKAQSPLDGKTYFFLDKNLPFGASISCSHFQRTSNAIAHIVKYRTKKDLINFLDDYFFVALMKLMCNRQMETFLEVCREISLPVAVEKTFWGQSTLLFLVF